MRNEHREYKLEEIIGENVASGFCLFKNPSQNILNMNGKLISTFALVGASVFSLHLTTDDYLKRTESPAMDKINS